MDPADERMFRALHHQAFRQLWGSAVFFQVGYWLASVGLQVVVAGVTHNDPVALGVLYFASYLPFLLLSLPVGAIVDTHDRRKLLIGIQAFGLVIAAACTGLAASGRLSVHLAAVVGFAAGTTIATASATNQALTPNVVPMSDVTSAVPLQAAGLNIARIAGPALAGPILLLGGPTYTFAVWALVCLTAVAVTYRLPRTLHQPTVGEREPLLRQISAGMAHTSTTPPARAALVTVAATSIFGSAYQAQLPVIAARISDRAESTFLVLVTLGGFGALGGLLWLGVRRRPPTLTGATTHLLVLSVTVALLGSTTSVVLVAVETIAAGGLIFTIMTSINTLLQQLVSDSYRGRVMSLYFICWGGLLPFGGLALGLLVNQIGSPVAFGIFGATGLLAGLTVLSTRNRRQGFAEG